MTDLTPRPVVPRKKRRWLKWLAGGLLLLLALVAALPWVLATPPAQRWLLKQANRALAPGGGRIAWTTLRVSWIGPMRLTGVVLRDAQGDPVIAAPTATLDRTLGELLFDRPRFGTLVLDRAAVDAERLPNGTIDIYETIKPVLNFDPRTQLKVVVPRGRLRYHAGNLPEPLEAEQADVTITVGPAPAPIAWSLDLKRTAATTPGDPPALTIGGRYDRWWQRDGEGAAKDLEVKLDGHRWPVAFDSNGVIARGVLDGQLGFERKSGRWSFSGAASLGKFDASGPILAGDHLRLDRLAGSWDLAETPRPGGTGSSWVISRLDVQSPIVTLKAAGPLPAPPGTSTRLEGSLDLAALAAQLPHALRLRPGIALERGNVRLQATSRTPGAADADAEAWDVAANVSDLLARDGERSITLKSPATLSARLLNQQGTWRLDKLALRTDFLEVIGVGDVDTQIAWTARLDLAGLQAQLRDLIDFGPLELEGRGKLTGEYRRVGTHFAGHAAATFHDLRIAGLDSGTLQRAEVRLDAQVDGPASESGLPRGWDHLQLGVTSGTLTASLAASARDATLTVAAPVTFSQRKGRLEGRLAARWDDQSATIEQARVALLPEPGGGEPLTIAAHGRFDRARGTLVLLPQPPAAALAIGPEGLRISGIGKEGGLRFDGALAGDLAALDHLARSWGLAPPAHAAGRFTAQADVRQAPEGWLVGARLDIPELLLPDEPAERRSAGRVRLALKATYQHEASQLDIAELVLASRYATLEAAGRLSDLDENRRADLLGTFTPDWKAINRLLTERIEPGARIAGRPRQFHLRGALPSTGGTPSDWLKPLDFEVGFLLDEANFFGMNLGPTPFVLRGREGRLRLDPIETTLNQGRIHLEPEIVLDDPAGPALRLGPESWVADARINDEVTHRVLAFAAPVLDNATRASGRVSVRLKEAVFPLGGGPEQARRTSVTGSVLFQDAQFTPGRIADQLYDMLGLVGVERPVVKLNQPVTLTIADRHVYQRGLVIPIGNLNEITMEGSVDFDRNLALNASLPLLPTMLRDRPLPVLTDLFGGLRITVPIRGTLAKPEVDREAFNLAMNDMGKVLLERAAPKGAIELFQRLFGPRDPNAPPPQTPAERRAQRQLRRQQRQMEP